MPVLPCFSVRANSRNWPAIRCSGVTIGQSSSIVINSRGRQTPIELSTAASWAIRSGSTSMNRDRWVLAPSSVPDPNWAKT